MAGGLHGDPRRLQPVGVGQRLVPEGVVLRRVEPGRRRAVATLRAQGGDPRILRRGGAEIIPEILRQAVGVDEVAVANRRAGAGLPQGVQAGSDQEL